MTIYTEMGGVQEIPLNFPRKPIIALVVMEPTMYQDICKNSKTFRSVFKSKADVAHPCSVNRTEQFGFRDPRPSFGPPINLRHHHVCVTFNMELQACMFVSYLFLQSLYHSTCVSLVPILWLISSANAPGIVMPLNLSIVWNIKYTSFASPPGNLVLFVCLFVIYDCR